jgi:hypothetical protein
MGYRFKAAFVNVSAIVDYGGNPKEVTAANLTAQDAQALIAQGQGQLIEACSDADAATALTTYQPVLDTATSQLPATSGPTDGQLHEVAEQHADSAEYTNELLIEATPPPIL